ncbi:MAG: prepilin-type N-terminal cleavage/methylation domain-containing protein [Acidobacteria bacterium]|nr:prepilin-type N-terminal cleavage/methylation domain-containing protein [Acidobacteriota bacterium]
MNLPHPLKRLDRRGEAGFSLVELLVAAFIMAVGLLGLAALETVALKSNTRSRSFNTAVLVANQVLDSVAVQARQSLQTQTYGGTVTYGNNYFGAAPVVEQFTYRGSHPDSTATNAVDKTAYFTATTSSANAGTYTGATGTLAIVTTIVTFQEASYQGGPIVTRTVTLSRTFNHG